MKLFGRSDKKFIDKRAIILNAALKTFVKRGYPDTKVAEIASEAGVAEGTIYNYFHIPYLTIGKKNRSNTISSSNSR